MIAKPRRSRNLHKAALEELVEAICDMQIYDDLEGGCEGNGPLIRALRVLRKRRPDSLVEWLKQE